MSPRRDCPDGDRPLKALFRALVGLCGGLEAAATVARLHRSRLAECYDMHALPFAPVDVVAQLEAVAGEPLVTAELARRAGFALVPLRPVDGGDVARSLAEVGREAGELFGAHAEALADGKLSPPELLRIAREAQDLARRAQDAAAIASGLAAGQA